jgi:hypothetical protein
MSIKRKMPQVKTTREIDYEQQNFEFIIENAGLSKFRTLKVFLIMKGDFKRLYQYDIMIPKANKAEEFAPLIEIAEKELENFEEEEDNGVSEDEFRQFVQDVYQQTLIDLVNDGNSSDEDDDPSIAAHINGMQMSPTRKINIVDNLASFVKISSETKKALIKGDKKSRLRIF